MTNTNNVSRLLSKKQTQSVLAQLRQAGFIVTKPNGIYTATDTNGTEVFRALIGSNGYLCLYNPSIFA